VHPVTTQKVYSPEDAFRMGSFLRKRFPSPSTRIAVQFKISPQILLSSDRRYAEVTISEVSAEVRTAIHEFWGEISSR
jgi:hypothetical protein